MMPRLLARDEWERRLRVEHRCQPFVHSGGSGLGTGEWWQTEHRRIFIVPADADGRVSTFDLQQVFVQIAKLRPLDLYD